MRIVSAKVANFKHIKLVEIDELGNVIQITGENGAGKSSFMDAITTALAGKRAAPEMPVRRGARRSRVEIDLGTHILTEVHTAKHGYHLELRVAGDLGDSAPLTAPRARISDLVGTGLVLDPIALMDQTPKQLRQTVLGLIGVDLAKFTQRHDRAYIKRRDVNRDLAGARARLGEPVEAPDEEVSLSALSKKLVEVKEEARRNQAARDEARRQGDQRDALSQEFERCSQQAEDLRARLQSMEVAKTSARVEYEGAHRTAVAASKRAGKLVDPEIDPILHRIDKAEGTNRKVRAKKAWVEGSMQVGALEGESSALSREIEGIEDEKLEALAGADMPVPGLEIDDEGLLLDGLPLNQIETSKVVTICTQIVAAMKPGLRVVFVKGGNDLSKKTFGAFVKICEKLDLQLWIERLEAVGDEGVLVIEKGEVADG